MARQQQKDKIGFTDDIIENSAKREKAKNSSSIDSLKAAASQYDFKSQGICAMQIINKKGVYKIILKKEYIIDNDLDVIEALQLISEGAPLDLNKYKNF